MRYLSITAYIKWNNAKESVRDKLREDDGVISTEVAVVAAVILVAAVAIASKLTDIFDDAVEKIPDSIDADSGTDEPAEE